MGKWAGKYVIGLTGNVGTGKSVVRRMLEHRGAYGIDADSLGHEVIAPGAPGYQAVIDAFGSHVLAADGQVDRKRLAQWVFSKPDALSKLEQIVHPLVIERVDRLVRQSSRPVVVIEAIKLLETPLHTDCDSIWVTDAPPEVQFSRLVEQRRWSEGEARQRIESQAPQEEKMSAANVVIHNDASLGGTWRQVGEAWQRLPVWARPTTPVANDPAKAILWAGPDDGEAIAGLIRRAGGSLPMCPEELAAHSEKVFWLLKAGKDWMGVLDWRVEDPAVCVGEVFLDPALPPEEALPLLLGEMEQAALELRCQAVLVAATPEWDGQDTFWRRQGYSPATPESLRILNGQPPATGFSQSGGSLFLKILPGETESRRL